MLYYTYKIEGDDYDEKNCKSYFKSSTVVVATNLAESLDLDVLHILEFLFIMQVVSRKSSP